jgi:hypothetical protein
MKSFSKPAALLAITLAACGPPEELVERLDEVIRPAAEAFLNIPNGRIDESPHWPDLYQEAADGLLDSLSSVIAEIEGPQCVKIKWAASPGRGTKRRNTLLFSGPDAWSVRAYGATNAWQGSNETEDCNEDDVAVTLTVTPSLHMGSGNKFEVQGVDRNPSAAQDQIK